MYIIGERNDPEKKIIIRQESVTTEQTDRHTHGQTDIQTPDKVIPMCRFASQVTQKNTTSPTHQTSTQDTTSNKSPLPLNLRMNTETRLLGRLYL